MKFLRCALLSLLSILMIGCESPPPRSEVSQPHTGIWIDARTAEEFNAGHLSDAKNIPYDVIGEQIAAVAPDKDTEINVYCRSGRRSEIARKTLQDMGYTKVVNAGSYEELMGR